MSPPRLKPGDLFEEKYRLIKRLGSGSFAVVLKARHEEMGRDVALKILKPGVLKKNPAVSRRFVNEVKIVSKLRHPNTVTIYDFGRAEDLHYMVLEYLEGLTVDRVCAGGPVDQDRAIHITQQVLKSLAEAHTAGIIHRDLKPSNIMLCQMHGESDVVKVLDFGVAKLLKDEKDAVVLEQGAPRSTRFIGTPVYMSPEQVLGHSVGPASDLYSLSLILYEMLVGEPPLAEDSVADVARLHLSKDPLPLRRLSTLSPRVQQLILRSTNRDPDERYGSVSAFTAALARAQRAGRDAGGAISAGSVDGEEPEADFDDVFSGKNYLAPVEMDPDLASARRPSGSFPPVDVPATAAPDVAKRRLKRRVTGSQQALRASKEDPGLALDLGSVRRQQLQARRRSSEASRGRRIGGYEPREYAVRGITYATGLVSAALSFLVITAALSGSPPGARWLAGGLLPVAAVLWTAFSGVRVVGADVERMWLLPTARNFSYLLGLVVLVTLFGAPATTAAGLVEQPLWFLGEVEDAGSFGALLGAAERALAGLGAVYSYVARLLPY